MIRRVLTSLFFLFAFVMIAQAQVGYQVSLLNTATGEPRANVTVNAQITITDSQNKTIYNGTQKAMSNDFGVLSLTVGDANTFAEAGTSKWPLFISVTVDGTLIGKSQILSVPVAEVANSLKSSFTKEELLGTWDYCDFLGRPINKFIFKDNREAEYIELEYRNEDDNYAAKEYVYKGVYEIEGNDIYIVVKCRDDDDAVVSNEDMRIYELLWCQSFLWWGGDALFKE